jgi:FAD/FMN-containing dehydrogenase
VFLGPEDELARLLQPLLAVGSPKLTTRTWPSWPDYFNAQNGGPRQFKNWKFSSSWAAKPLPGQALQVVRDFMAKAPTDPCNFWCLNWGGATRRAPARGAAFFHRSPLLYSEPGVAWNDDADKAACLAWVTEFREAIRPYVVGAYANVPDRAIQDFGTAYYGTNYKCLRKVKGHYDPQNVFQFEQSIPPR